MKDITVIIPVHEHNDFIKSLLNRAIVSVPSEYKIVVSTSLEVDFSYLTEEYSNVNILTNSAKNDFCSLVNYAVNEIDTKWFSILEFDDEYTNIWFNNVEKYIEYNPEVSVFLPLEELIDFNQNKFIGYGNEAPWASSFSNEIGYIDNDCLQQYFDFYLTGAIFNTEDWKTYGGLKPSIKISFWYEFLLRITNKGKKVFVIPKLGYKHYVDRENSLYDIYRKTIDEKESTWYFEIAKQECFYIQDRNKTYENKEKEGE